MITGMSNPIGSVKPNFGMYTLGKDNNVLTKMFANVATRSQDVVERTPLRGDIGKELSAKELAKEFG